MTDNLPDPTILNHGKDMIKPHKYDYEVKLDSQMAPAKVIRMVGAERRVLEIGAGPGSITKLLQGVGKCRVTALEIDSEAIQKLTPYCERVYQADLNDATWVDKIKGEGQFEVIVLADVLEHVYEPLTVLSAAKAFLQADGSFVVSLPHVGHSAIHACMLQEDFEYRNWGLLDRTHIRFFGIKNIQALFENAGLKIVHAEFVVLQPEATEFAEKWANTPADTRSVLARNPFGTVYQVVVKAVPVEAAGQAISLLGVPVAGYIAPGATTPAAGPAPAVPSYPALRALARKLLPVGARAALRRNASRIGISL